MSTTTKKMKALCKFLLANGIDENNIVRSVALYGYEKVRFVAEYFYKNKKRFNKDIFYHSLNEFIIPKIEKLGG